MLTIPSPPLVPQVIDATAAIAPRATPNIKAPPVPRRRARPRDGRRWARFLPAVTALQLAAVAAVLLARVEVVRVMPEAAPLFRMIGLPVNLRGLAFSDVTTTRETHDGVTVLLVQGTITNVSRQPRDVPRIRLAMKNGAGAEVYTWTQLPGRGSLGAGESEPFNTRLASPPADGRDVVVRFFNRHDIARGGR